MVDISKAKALLEAATLKRKCDDAIRRQGCKSCDEWWPIAVPAQLDIARMGFSVATLAWAIAAAEALEVARCQGCTESKTCKRCQSRAAWPKLWEEAPRALTPQEVEQIAKQVVTEPLSEAHD